MKPQLGQTAAGENSEKQNGPARIQGKTKQYPGTEGDEKHLQTKQNTGRQKQTFKENQEVKLTAIENEPGKTLKTQHQNQIIAVRSFSSRPIKMT